MERIMWDIVRSKSRWNASCRTSYVRSPDGTHHVGHRTFEVQMQRIMSDIERSKSRWNASCWTSSVRSPDGTHHVGHRTFDPSQKNIFPPNPLVSMN